MGLDERGVRGETMREIRSESYYVFTFRCERREREILNENTSKKRIILII